MFFGLIGDFRKVEVCLDPQRSLIRPFFFIMRNEEIRFAKTSLIGVNRKKATERLQRCGFPGAIGPNQESQLSKIDSDWLGAKRLETTHAHLLEYQRSNPFWLTMNGDPDFQTRSI